MAKSAPAPLSAALLGVPKGAAIPASDPVPAAAPTSTPDPVPTPTPTPAPTHIAAPQIPEVVGSDMEPVVGQGGSISAPVSTSAPIAQPISKPLVRRRVPEPVPPPMDEVRTALTVRLPITTQERLREAAHRTRREKQVIVDEALQLWMDTYGY